MENAIDQLILGTAQLGLRYGVANTTGQPSGEAAGDLVARAWRGGIRAFDTAQAYGSSEEVLGASLARITDGPAARIVSKLHPELGGDDGGAVLESVAASRRRLGVERLWGLLLHREEAVARWTGSLGAAVREAKARGWVQHVGASFYSADRAMAALDLRDVTMIQVAASVFDRRMTRAGVWAKARKLGVEVCVRSIYLQGLALMTEDRVPASIPRAKEAVSCFRSFCRDRGVEPAGFALGYVRRRYPEARWILGAETREQVDENLRLAALPVPAEALCAAWDRCWPEDVLPLADPSRWNRKA